MPEARYLRGWVFDSILQQRAAPGAIASISQTGGTMQVTIEKVFWPMLWTERRPLHASHDVELQCGEE